MSTKSFSYFELMNGKITLSKLEAVTNARGLNEETLARIGHVGRFYQRIRTASPNFDLKIGDVLTGDVLQKFWNETAERRDCSRPMSASALGCHADSLRAFVAGHRPSLSGHADVHCSGQPMSAFGR